MRENQRARHRKQEKKKTSMLATLCILTALAFVLSTGAASLARYAMERHSDGTAVAAPFYFTSDLLGEEPPHTQLAPPESGDTVDLVFTLSNHIDDLRCSQANISYICDAYAGSKLVSLSPAQGSLRGGTQTDTVVTLKVNKSSFNDGPVTVVAKATAPYEKELRGEFSFIESGTTGIQTAVREENGAVVLELAGSCELAAVTWPAGLIPDPSCEYLSNASAGDTSANIFYAPEERCALTFLKTDPNSTYQKSDFTVTAMDGF